MGRSKSIRPSRSRKPLPRSERSRRGDPWSLASMNSKSHSLHLAGMSVQVISDAESACRSACELITKTIRASVALRGRAVLGLATGSTPERVYALLADRHDSGELSFRDVTTYNLDEYYPISPLDSKSYRSYMHRHLFSRVDIAPGRGARPRRYRSRSVRGRARGGIRSLDRGGWRPGSPAPGDRPQRTHRLQ